MPERPSSGADVYDDAAPRDEPPELDGRDDELAAAFAAVFNMSADEPEAPVEAPASPAFVADAGADGGDDADAEWAPAAVVVPADGGEASSWWDSEPDVDVSPTVSPPEADKSATALQDAGFASPLHSALGELGRITTPSAERTEVATAPAAPSETAVLPPGGGGTPDRNPGPGWLSADGLRQAWQAHRRDWGPGLIVAALVVIAFAVVLTAGDGDRRPSRVETRSSPTTVVPTTVADVPTTVFEEVLPPDLAVDPGVAASDADISGEPSAPAALGGRRSSRAPAASPAARQAPPSGGAPAPAPAPVNPPANDSPEEPSGNPPSGNDDDDGTTVTSRPPQTNTTTLPPDVPDDPCALLSNPQAQAQCREHMGGSG